jgi:hypothetical protein
MPAFSNASIGIMVMKIAANSIATSCIGAQVKQFSTRSGRGVVHQDRRLMAINTVSRTRPLTGISSPRPTGTTAPLFQMPLISTVSAMAMR